MAASPPFGGPSGRRVDRDRDIGAQVVDAVEDRCEVRESRNPRAAAGIQHDGQRPVARLALEKIPLRDIAVLLDKPVGEKTAHPILKGIALLPFEPEGIAGLILRLGESLDGTRDTGPHDHGHAVGGKGLAFPG